MKWKNNFNVLMLRSASNSRTHYNCVYLKTHHAHLKCFLRLDTGLKNGFSTENENVVIPDSPLAYPIPKESQYICRGAISGIPGSGNKCPFHFLQRQKEATHIREDFCSFFRHETRKVESSVQYMSCVRKYHLKLKAQDCRHT